LATLNNPQISELILTNFAELEESSSDSDLYGSPDDNYLDIQTSRREFGEEEHNSFLAGNITTFHGPLVSSSCCVCKCHDKAHNSRRSQLEAVLPPAFSSIASRCTNFDCCARKNTSRLKIVFSQRWLRKFSIISISKGKPGLRNSIPHRVIVTEGSDVIRYSKYGNIKGLKWLLSHGKANPSAITPDGWTLLHVSVYYSQRDTTKLLLEQKANVDATEDGNRTAADLAMIRALMIGSSQLQKDIAMLFPGAEDFKDSFELTPVHIAVLGLHDHEDRVRPDLSTILDFIDDAENEPSHTNWKNFRVGEQKKSQLFQDVIRFYAERTHPSADKNKARMNIIDMPDKKQGWSPFLWAAYTGRREALEILIKNGASPFTFSEKKRNALHLAAESKDPETMSYVLERPSFQGTWFDINHHDYWGESPLHIAASRSAQCAQLLLDRGADRDARQYSKQVPLHYVSLGPDSPTKLQIADLLSADKGAHINAQDEEGRTPVFELLDTPECVKLLVDRGADISIRDNSGKTVFHHSAIENAAESLKILLGCVPTPLSTATDDEGNTPLSTAKVDKGKTRLSTATDDEGNTPISLSFQHESAAAAKLLIESDAIGDFHGKDGWALVHHAAIWGDADVLEAVLRHPNFRRGTKTPDGKSAADLAKSARDKSLEAGNFKGRTKQLLKEYDSIGQVGQHSLEDRADKSRS
jgi:ankyrin repeat protein